MNNSDKTSSFNSDEFLTAICARQPRESEMLVLAYTGQLFKGALGLGFDKNAAHDLVQNCWATFFDVIHSFERRSHIRTFLFGILYNKASEMRRDQKKYEATDDIEAILNHRFDERGHWITPPISGEKFMLASETLDLIQACLETLPLAQRMAFCLKEVDGEEPEEICNVLEVSVTNLRVLLFRARNRLRTCVEGKSGTTRTK